MGRNISKLVVTDVALSDHSCVFFESSITVHTIVKKEVTTRRHLTENAQEMFAQTCSPSIAHANFSVNELVDHFNSKITNVMDTIAPIKKKRKYSKKISPWRKAMTVRTAKTECRKAERRWIKQISKFTRKYIKRDSASIIRK